MLEGRFLRHALIEAIGKEGFAVVHCLSEESAVVVVEREVLLSSGLTDGVHLHVYAELLCCGSNGFRDTGSAGGVELIYTEKRCCRLSFGEFVFLLIPSAVYQRLEEIDHEGMEVFLGDAGLHVNGMETVVEVFLHGQGCPGQFIFGHLRGVAHAFIGYE